MPSARDELVRSRDGCSRDRRWAYAVGCAGPLVVALLVASGPLRTSLQPSLLGQGALAALADNLVQVRHDDGFYYAVLARHMAAGAGPTFDGLEATSGYHPLWLLVLTPLAWLFRDPVSFVVASGALEVLLLAGALGVTYVWLRGRSSASAAAFGSLGLLGYAVASRVLLSGLEWSLQVLLLALVVVAVERGAGRELFWRRALMLGVLLAALGLARLEAFLMAPIVALLWGVRASGRCWVRSLSALLFPAVLAGVLVGLVNLRLTGHPLPVSADVKAEWSRVLLAADPVYREHGYVAAKLSQLVWPLTGGRQRLSVTLLLLAGTLGGFALLTWPQPPRAWPSDSLRPLAAYALLQMGLLQLSHHGGFGWQPWYFAAQPLLACAVVARLSDLAQARLRSLPVLRSAPFVAALLIASDAALWRRVTRARGETSLSTLAREVHTRVGPDQRVGAWNAGQIAYLSGRTVLNLDGLVASRAFFEHGRHDLCRYCREQGIVFLADVFPERDFAASPEIATLQPRLPCPDGARVLWSQPAGAVTLQVVELAD